MEPHGYRVVDRPVTEDALVVLTVDEHGTMTFGPGIDTASALSSIWRTWNDQHMGAPRVLA